VFDLRKLGRCPFCIRWATLLTVGAWALVAIAWMLGVRGPILLACVGVAMLPTSLALAHLAFLSRRVADRMEADDALPGAETMSRRQFQTLALKWSLGAVVALAFGAMPKGAVAGEFTCGDGVTFTPYARTKGMACERAQAKILARGQARRLCKRKCGNLTCDDELACKLDTAQLGQAQAFQRRDAREFAECPDLKGWVYILEVTGCACECR
jgi:hypothetical protein